MTAVKACETCGWWKPYEAELQPQAILDDIIKLGLASPPKLPPLPAMGECGLFECRRMEQVHSDSKLIVTRTGSGEATIVTHSDFGCVQHEERR